MTPARIDNIVVVAVPHQALNEHQPSTSTSSATVTSNEPSAAAILNIGQHDSNNQNPINENGYVSDVDTDEVKKTGPLFLINLLENT